MQLLSTTKKQLRTGLLSLAVCASVSIPTSYVHASGVNLEGLGIRAVSMGGAFTGLADDASAIFWNPAGLAQLKGAGYTIGVYSMNAKSRDKTGTTNKPLNAGFDPNKGDIFPGIYDTEPNHFDDEDELWVGAGTMPAFVMYKNYGRYTLAGGVYGVGGAYSEYNDNIYDTGDGSKIEGDVFNVIGVVAVNSSIGYQLTEKLSIGVGLDLLINFWRADLEKNYTSETASMYDYEFKQKVRKIGYGFQGNFGALYKFNEQWSVGANYRTGTDINLKGDTWASLRSDNPDLIDAGIVSDEKSDGHSNFTYGASWNVGVAYKPTTKLTFTADYKENDWSEFKWPSSNVTYDDPGILLRNDNREPGWKRAHGYSLGAEYFLDNGITLRAGYTNEESGVPPAFENTVTTTLGDIQMVNFGMGMMYNDWKVDFLVGTMWGDNGLGTSHVCYDFGVSFMKML